MSKETIYNIIAYYQIIGGILGFHQVANQVYYKPLGNLLNLFYLSLFVMLYGFLILAGIMMIKKNSLGIKLSIFGQCLQVMQFSFININFVFISGASLIIFLGNSFKFYFSLMSTRFSFYLGQTESEFWAINLIPIFIIFFLNNYEVLESNDKQSFGNEVLDKDLN